MTDHELVRGIDLTTLGNESNDYGKTQHVADDVNAGLGLF